MLFARRRRGRDDAGRVGGGESSRRRVEEFSADARASTAQAPDLRVAPTFDDGGRLPEPEDHETIEGTFDAPLNTSAFRTERKPEPLDEPPAPAPKRKRDDDDDEPAKTGDWLKDSLARQKKGIHSLRHDRHSGPAMLFDSHEA